MVAVYSAHYKEKGSSICHQARVQYSILMNKKWFRFLVPWSLATLWLVWGIKEQRKVVRLQKVQAMFERPVDTVAHNYTTRHEYLCRLDRQGTGSHFSSSIYSPYIAEWMTGCWSWLEAHNATNNSHNENDDMSVASTISFDKRIFQNVLVNPNMPKWNREFFKALHIPVLMIPNSKMKEELSKSSSSRLATRSRYNSIFLNKPSGSEAWFGDLNSCRTMREVLWKSLNIDSSSVEKNIHQIDDGHFHIGIADQASKRIFTDDSWFSASLEGEGERMEGAAMSTTATTTSSSSLSFVQQLQSYWKNSTISVRVFERQDSLQTQAAWFAKQDILVVPHGSITTNILFMKPGAQVLEVFLDPQSVSKTYQILAKQCGYHYDWWTVTQQHQVQDNIARNDGHPFVTLEQLKMRIEQMIVNTKQQ